jgi:hypothetical protein
LEYKSLDELLNLARPLLPYSDDPMGSDKPPLLGPILGLRPPIFRCIGSSTGAPPINVAVADVVVAGDTPIDEANDELLSGFVPGTWLDESAFTIV